MSDEKHNSLAQALLAQYSASISNADKEPGLGILVRPKVESVYYNGKQVTLDGYSFIGCRFDNCVLSLSSTNFEISHCVIDPSCRIMYSARIAKVVRLYLSRYPWASVAQFDEFFLPTIHPDGTMSVEEKTK